MKTGTLGLSICLLALCSPGCSEKEPEKIQFYAFRLCADPAPPETNAEAITAMVFTSEHINRLIFTPHIIQSGVVTKLEPMLVPNDMRKDLLALGFYLTRKPGPEGDGVYQACLNPINPLPITELKGYDRVEGSHQERKFSVRNEANKLHIKVLLYPPGTKDIPISALNDDDISSLIEHSKKHKIDYFGFNIQARPSQ